ncbi:hypothetical protein [Actinomadura rugatobispora]|uniref:Uncharacterized protein n=1 Tax=Actinomadura rugatobispora TaxID=1994 RepID=A0ABW0ZN97_9ACTN|nr:hypothetical protein GCM10010200_035770 [Actinomadura rugatobispora]
MPARDPKARSEIARTAALVNLAKQANWVEMTAPARRKSPVTFEYWLDRTKTEHPDAPPRQQQRMAEAAWRARQRQNSKKAVEARKAKRQPKPKAGAA